MVWVDPHGNVMIRYGLCIGSLERRHFASIVARYDPAANPVIDRLAQKGPRGLHALAAEGGVAPAPRAWADECELCFASRAALRPLYPDPLAPAECYRDR